MIVCKVRDDEMVIYCLLVATGKQKYQEFVENIQQQIRHEVDEKGTTGLCDFRTAEGKKLFEDKLESGRASVNQQIEATKPNDIMVLKVMKPIKVGSLNHSFPKIRRQRKELRLSSIGTFPGNVAWSISVAVQAVRFPKF